MDQSELIKGQSVTVTFEATVKETCGQGERAYTVFDIPLGLGDRISYQVSLYNRAPVTIVPGKIPEPQDLGSVVRGDYCRHCDMAPGVFVKSSRRLGTIPWTCADCEDPVGWSSIPNPRLVDG